MNDKDKAEKIENFLMEDYKLKVQFLTAQFTRMWSRFQYFLVFETTLSAALFGLFKDAGGFSVFSIPIAVIGALSSIFWYISGAEDRFLVLLYRQHIKHAMEQFVKQIKAETELKAYPHAGQTKGTELAEEKRGVFQWRWDEISTTRLAAMFPWLVIAWWIIMIVIIVQRLKHNTI